MLPIPLQDGATKDAESYVELAKELITLYGMKVVAAVAILGAGWFVVGIVTGGVRKALSKSKIDVTLQRFLCNVTRMLLLTFVVVAAIAQLGVQTASLVAVIGAAGFAIGFALQGSLSNFAAGVMIMFFRPFKAGDVVEAAGEMGKVHEVGIFNTIILTFDNKRVIVANASVTGANITNYSAMDTRRVDLKFGISYGDDMKKAKDLIHKVLAKDARVLKDPAPTIVVGELGDSSVNILCRPWVKTADYWGVYWDTLEAVKESFDANGITIPFPQRDVHMHQVA
ncbi:MAG TPA: mechanosensitive ion channel domain-containing protein [Planctomycetota bacterium]|nr:mechanosensitive ion channel domain-containing protein [Planctomycetota bacterium]